MSKYNDYIYDTIVYASPRIAEILGNEMDRQEEEEESKRIEAANKSYMQSLHDGSTINMQRVIQQTVILAEKVAIMVELKMLTSLRSIAVRSGVRFLIQTIM